jgi:hypothetical protein
VCFVVSLIKKPSPIKYWYFWKYNLEVMQQYSSYFYFFIFSSRVSDIHLLFCFLCPRHSSVCSTIKVMLPNIIVLLHSYSPVLSTHAQSNADKFAMCHGCPQCHMTVTAECQIISSPPLLFLSDRHFLCSPAQFFIHSNFVTSHWRSVLQFIHHHPTNKQHSIQHSIP